MRVDRKYLLRMIGMGIMAIATKPSNEEAHWGPKASYICEAKSYSG
jgi:hypothetical protein